MNKKYVFLVLTAYVVTISFSIFTRSLNGILIFEKGNIERAYHGDPFDLFYLREAILSEKAAIIVSGPILHSFVEFINKPPEKETIAIINNYTIKWKENNERLKQLDNLYPELLKKAKITFEGEELNYSSFKKLYKTIQNNQRGFNSKWFKLVGQDDTLNKKYCLRLLDLSNWSKYQVVNTDFYILIPHKYEQALHNQWKQIKGKRKKTIQEMMSKIQSTERELMLGLYIDHADLVKKILNQKELINLLQNNWGKKQPKIPAKLEGLFNLKKIFIPGKHDLGTWNIFWTGHGEESTLMREQNKKAQIAGIDLNQFKDFLSFLYNNISTSFVYWITCFGGGYHLDGATKILRHLENIRLVEEAERGVLDSVPSGFIAASGSLTDSAVWAAGIFFDYVVQCSEKTSFINFNTFFDTLYKFEMDIKRAKEVIKNMLNIPPARRDHFLKGILVPQLTPVLQSVTLSSRTYEDPYGIASTPSIYLPGWRRFKVVSLGDEIVVLDKERISQHMFDFQYKEGKPILVKNNEPLNLVNKKVLLIYEKEIPTPLSIILDERKKFELSYPGFVSMIPENAYHRLDKIEIKKITKTGEIKSVYSQDVFEGLFFHIFTLYHKVFKIKTIKGVRFFDQSKKKFYDELYDVIILRSGEIKSENDKKLNFTSYTILFSVEDKDIPDNKAFYKADGSCYYEPVCSIWFDFKQISQEEAQQTRREILKKIK